MYFKIVVALLALHCLGAVVVHGLQCCDSSNSNVTCTPKTAHSTVLQMQKAFNVSSTDTYPSYTCITMNITFSKFKINH